MKHIHDCTSCKYLGSYIAPKEVKGGIKDGWIDVYICNDTLISRYGSDGWSYTSLDIVLIQRVLHDGAFKNSLNVRSYKMYQTEIEGI